MKKVFCILAVILTVAVGVLAYEAKSVEAAEYIVEEVDNNEVDWVDREDLPCPYTLYVMGVHTTITNKDDGKIYMGVQVYCTETMQEITTVFYLQQKISDTWINVCTGTITSEDIDHHVKVMSVRNAPSGNYRVKTVNRVRDYNGYTESVTGYSPEMTYYNPDL